jgi:hypothetical protein
MIKYDSFGNIYADKSLLPLARKKYASRVADEYDSELDEENDLREDDINHSPFTSPNRKI